VSDAEMLKQIDDAITRELTFYK